MPPTVDGTPGKQALAAAWALNQIGRRDYYMLCERFIENAYGTQGRYGSASQASGALNWGRDPEQADVGDLVFFRPDASNGNYGHVGIYMGNGEMISATNGGITRDNIFTNNYWKNLFVGFGDPPEQWQGRPATQDLVEGAAQIAGNAKAAVGNAAGAAKQWATAAWGAAAPYAGMLAEAAAEHDVPVNVLAGLLIQESGGNPRAVSGAGAQGLMQFMPGTARGLGIDPFDPAQAIDAGARYLKQLADQSGGDWSTAVGKYNAGPAGNLNNSETRNHIVKVMGYADTIASGMGSGGPGGGSGFAGPPGGGGPPRGGGGDDEMPQGEPPNVTRLKSGLGDLFGRIGEWMEEGNQAAGRGVVGRQRATYPPGQTPNLGGATAGLAGRGTPPPPTIPPMGWNQGALETGGSPRMTDEPGTAGGTVEPAGPRGGPTGAAGGGERAKPQGWIDPNTISSDIYKGIIGISNGLLEDIQNAEDELSRLPDTPQNMLRRQQLQQIVTNSQARLVQLSPQLRQIEQEEAGGREGTVAPGTTPYMKKIPVYKKVDGKWTVEYIDNPGAPEDPSLTRGREADTAAMARVAAQEAGATARSAASDAAAMQRVQAQEAGATERTNLTNTTNRVTTALSQAVEQRRQDIDGQIRAGELSLKEGTEQFNQWYKQNVEAPLAILDRQQKAAEYQVTQQRAATERATAMAEHERGIANIGQQMWNSASDAYTKMIPLTVGEGWGQGFQQNLAQASTGQYTPNTGATYNVPESLDAFATRKVAEMLSGVSPYAQNLLQSQQQVGADGTAPPTSAAMQGLTDQAAGVASNALANPFQMPALPDFQMPGQVDIGGMAGAGMPNGSRLTNQIDQYLPSYTG